MADEIYIEEMQRLRIEIGELRIHLEEAEETLRAIRNGEVDAIVVSGKEGEKIFTLKSAETPYRIILEEMNEGAVIISAEGIILYCNRRFAEMISVPQERISGSNLKDFILESDRKVLRNLLDKSLKSRTNGIISFLSGDKIRIYARLSLVSLPADQDGDVCIVVSDITELQDYQDILKRTVERRTAQLKKANQKLSEEFSKIIKGREKLVLLAHKYKLLYQKLSESEEKYRQLVESANSIIMKADHEGFITFMNKYALNFFGYTEEEVIGRHFIGTTTPEKDSMNRDLTELTGRILRNPENFLTNENENMRKDGTRVWISWTNKAILDKKGKLTGILSIGNDVTAFREIEKALAQSEEKYRKIVETAAEGVIILSPENRFNYVNNKMAEMLGYTTEEILGKSGLDFMYDDVSEEIIRIRKKAKYSHVKGEIKFRRKDGSLLWTSFNTSPLYDDKGKYIGILSMLTDITNSKKSEEELYRSEERFRTAFEEGAIAMAIVTVKGEFLRVNRAFSLLTGYSQEELMKMKFQNLTHPDDLELNLAGLSRLIEGEIKSFRMEKRYIRKNGEIIWVDMSTAPVMDKYGKIEYLVTHIQDINKRKKVQTELEASREKLEIALDSGHIGIWQRNLKNEEVIWDERMEKIFGIAPGSFGKTNKAFEELINEEDIPHFRNAVSYSLETGSLMETVFRVRPGDGNSKYISTKALVNKNESGSPVSLTGVCFDVTAMKRGAESAIVKLNEELLRSNKELESFAYVASHDLQEPLRMISSFTQMLEKQYGDKLDQNAREYIKYAVDGAKRMYDLINGLLAYSRIQTKGKEFQQVNMADVLEKVKRNLRLLITEKNAVITANDLPVVFADESQMIQLVQNLVENGIKFSMDKPRIHIESRNMSDNYIFSVKDRGIGIEAQYFDRIFKIFQRLMPKDEYEGTGIGLAICRRIVERHNGRIWVESKPGKGSTFFFTIPKLKTG
ncbi:MAG: PAS domain S-box protein [Bacteroidota bacterium]|nr:PAS domain S-box protein [Bacteroidota bacterium]